MIISVFLADASTNDPSGKINALGAGWSFVPSPLPPHAVCVIAEVDHEHHNKPIQFVFELLDADEQPVELPGPAGPQPVKAIMGGLLAFPPPGAPTGTPSNLVAQATIGGPGFELPGGATYKWRVTALGPGDAHLASAVARFYVLAQIPPPTL